MSTTTSTNRSTSLDAPSSPSSLGTPAILSHAPSKGRDKANVVNGFVALKGALSANARRNATYELPSGTFTVPELTDEIDEYIGAVSDVAAAARAFHAAVEREKKLRATAFARRAELKAVIAGRVGKHAIEMVKYGFAPAKVRVVSPKAKLLGALKAKATRLARGTMGRRQKLAITGNVTGVIITPVTHATGATGEGGRQSTEVHGVNATDAPGTGGAVPGGS